MGKNRHKFKGSPAQVQKEKEGVLAELNLTPIQTFQLFKILDSFQLRKSTIFFTDRWYTTWGYGQSKLEDSEIMELYEKFKKLTSFMKLTDSNPEPKLEAEVSAAPVKVPLPEIDVSEAQEILCSVCQRPTANPLGFCQGDEVAGCQMSYASDDWEGWGGC